MNFVKEPRQENYSVICLTIRPLVQRWIWNAGNDFRMRFCTCIGNIQVSFRNCNAKTRMLCVLFGWSWLSISGEDLFHVIGLLSSLGDGLVHYVNILESLWSKDVLCQIWLNLQSRSRVSSCLCIFTAHCYLPLEKVLALHLKKLKILFNQGWLGHKASLENGKSFFNGRATSSSTGRWLLKQLYAMRGSRRGVGGGPPPPPPPSIPPRPFFFL